MGTNVNLTPELDRLARACVESGRFGNVGEDAERRRAVFVASLEAAREEGLRQGLATVDEVQDEVSAAIDMVRSRPE